MRRRPTSQTGTRLFRVAPSMSTLAPVTTSCCSPTFFTTSTRRRMRPCCAKVHASLADGGRAVTLEFVPNDDRVTPPESASFSMMMLTSTPSGDAYTFAELEKMAANAGFSKSTVHPLPPTIQNGGDLRRSSFEPQMKRSVEWTAGASVGRTSWGRVASGKLDASNH